MAADSIRDPSDKSIANAGGVSPTSFPTSTAGASVAAGAVGGAGAGVSVGATAAVAVAASVAAGAGVVGAGGSAGDCVAAAVTTAAGASVAVAAGEPEVAGGAEVAVAASGSLVAGCAVVGGDAVVAAGATFAGVAGAGVSSAPHATTAMAKSPATAKPLKYLETLFILSGWRRQRRRSLLSSSRQLHVHQPPVLFLLDFRFGWYGVWVGGQRGELWRPLVRAAHQLSVVDNAIGVYRHHRHLARDFQVGQHGSDRLRGDHIGVSVLFDIRCNRRRGFIVGDDVEVDFRKLAGDGVQRL